MSVLRRTDIEQENFKIGETVKIFGVPSQLAGQRFFATNVLRQQGQELVLQAATLGNDRPGPSGIGKSSERDRMLVWQ